MQQEQVPQSHNSPQLMPSTKQCEHVRFIYSMESCFPSLYSGSRHEILGTVNFNSSVGRRRHFPVVALQILKFKHWQKRYPENSDVDKNQTET